jgi:hypothetical protein
MGREIVIKLSYLRSNVAMEKSVAAPSVQRNSFRSSREFQFVSFGGRLLSLWKTRRAGKNHFLIQAPQHSADLEIKPPDRAADPAKSQRALASCIRGTGVW